MHKDRFEEEKNFSIKSFFIPLTNFKVIHWFIIIGFIVFGNSLFNGFIWDDESFITKNVYVQQFNLEKIFTSSIDAGQGVVSNYYRPFTSLTFAIDTWIWKQNAFGFHLTNVLLHISSCVILFLLLINLRIGRLTAFVISLVFLVHPIQTEAVTYISSRSDSLYTFFLFSSLYFFLRLIRNESFKYFLLCTLFFIFSFLSKETAITTIFLFPLIIFMEFISTKQTGMAFIQKQKKAFFTTLNIFVIVITYLGLRLTVLNFANTLNFFAQLSNLSPTQHLYATHLDVRLYTFGKVLWEYMGILLFPYNLHMYRKITYVTSFFSIWVIGALLLILFIISLSIYEIRRQRTAFILFGFLLSATTLLPVSGIVPINWVLFEHWLYVPIVGFLIIIFRFCQIFIPQLFLNKKIKNLITYLSSIIICVLMLLTMYQNSLWSDPIKLYTYTLQFTKTAPIYNNLGMSYAEKGDSDNAIFYYQKSLDIQVYPQTLYNLGIEYKLQKNYSLAEKAFQEALTLIPDFPQAKENLVVIYLRTGQYEKASQLSNNNPKIQEIINSLEVQTNK